MSLSDDQERYVLDACVVIDFCGRTDNLTHLMAYVGAAGVITSSVNDELERQYRKRFPLLAAFFQLVSTGAVQIIDPDLTNETADRIVRKWTPCFGAGEVSSAALAGSRRWVFVSRDREPMRQLRLAESLMMESTTDILESLVRRGEMTRRRAKAVEYATRKAATTRRRR